MPFTFVIKSEFDFGALLKKPFDEETVSFESPVDLIINQIDGVRKTYRDVCFPMDHGFSWDRHKHLTCRLSLLNIK